MLSKKYCSTIPTNYEEAYILVKELLEHNKHFHSQDEGNIIKRIRKKKPKFNTRLETDILEQLPSFQQDKARRLCEPFNYFIK